MKSTSNGQVERLRQRIIGLTGGIATGKSTVAGMLAARGLPVVDADALAREAVVVGSPALVAIVDRYGPQIVDREGRLVRSALGHIIFADAAERRWLEGQIHPYVRRRLCEFVAEHPQAPCLCLVVPLLFEADMTDLVTDIWVVSCPIELQVQRLAERDGLDAAEVERRIASQWPLAEKVARATAVLVNDRDLRALEAQVNRTLEALACRC